MHLLFVSCIALEKTSRLICPELLFFCCINQPIICVNILYS